MRLAIVATGSAQEQENASGKEADEYGEIQGMIWTRCDG